MGIVVLRSTIPWARYSARFSSSAAMRNSMCPSSPAEETFARSARPCGVARTGRCVNALGGLDSRGVSPDSFITEQGRLADDSTIPGRVSGVGVSCEPNVPKASILGSSVQSRLPREQSVSAVRCLAVTPPKASGGSRSQIFGVVEAGRRNLGTEKQAQVSPHETRSRACGESGPLSRSSHSRCPADVVSPHRIPAGPQGSPEVLDTSLQHTLPTSSGQHGRPGSELHSVSSGVTPEAPNISTVWGSVERRAGPFAPTSRVRPA